MRAASPVSCEPELVMAPVMGAVPSRNSGNCGLPLVRLVTVAVAAMELTVVPAPALSTCSVVTEGLENWRLAPRAALSCETTEAIPPLKLTPITGLLGLDGLLG